jgi:exo-beta-1,3-glucanase (GH17 family)
MRLAGALVLAGIGLPPAQAAESPGEAGTAQVAATPLRPVAFEMNGTWIGNAVCFSPYRRGQAPRGAQPTDEEIYQDLRLAQRYWSLLRLYDSSPVVERTLRLIREHHLPLRVLLGCWIDTDSVPANRVLNLQEAARAIRLAHTYGDLVLAVNVGNETQVNWSADRSDPDALIGYIRQVRGAVSQPVSCADDYSYWKTPESKRISAELDFVMVNLYALWNGQPLSQAMAWTAGVYDEIRVLNPGRPIVISETGWATRHDLTKTGPGGEASLMKAEASVAAQEDYLRQHYAWVDRNRVPTFLFEAFDESWKGGGSDSSPDVAEKHWGVFDEDRRPKASFAAFAKSYYR